MTLKKCSETQFWRESNSLIYCFFEEQVSEFFSKSELRTIQESYNTFETLSASQHAQFPSIHNTSYEFQSNSTSCFAYIAQEELSSVKCQGCDEELAEGWTPVLFGYAGGLQDRDSGLVKFGARDYDPEVGRWTGPDSSQGARIMTQYENSEMQMWNQVNSHSYSCDEHQISVLSGKSETRYSFIRCYIPKAHSALQYRRFPSTHSMSYGFQSNHHSCCALRTFETQPPVNCQGYKEPLGFNGASNFYVYAGNDPVNYVDIDGLFAWFIHFRLLYLSAYQNLRHTIYLAQCGIVQILFRRVL